MTAATKKRPAKAATTQAPTADLADLPIDPDGPIGPDGEIRPVRIGKRGRTPNPMIDLFELDGRMYQIPAKPGAALVIRFLREYRNKRIGPDLATENLLISLIGQEAWDALAESPEVTAEDVADVLTIVATIATAEVKKITGAAGN